MSWFEYKLLIISGLVCSFLLFFIVFPRFFGVCYSKKTGNLFKKKVQP